jgi:cyclopropane-fatty-acyl-phospholipid synthase
MREDLRTIDPAARPAPRAGGGVLGALAPFLVRALSRRYTPTIELHDDGAAAPIAHTSGGVGVTVHDHRTYSALLRRTTAGLGEAYIAGWFDCDDLTGLIRAIISGSRPPFRVADGIANRIAPFVDGVTRHRGPSKATDRDNVRAHYDLSNAFFELLLDETMSYSCAIFDHPDEDLATASARKVDRLFGLCDLSFGDDLVEIGTGWGWLAARAAERGANVTTTTLSTEQHAHATALAAERGVADRVRVLETDYRDLDGSFDKLISVEMIEAVGWREFDTYFATCSRLLRPHGCAAIQAITINDRSYERAKHRPDFIKDAVFPGGCIPSVTAIARSIMRASDLRIVALDDIGLHYAETLRRWRANLDTHADAIRALGFNEEFLRLWRLYLSYCEAGFLERHISDIQILLAKPGWKPPERAVERMLKGAP